jgi:hypothetical protein
MLADPVITAARGLANGQRQRQLLAGAAVEARHLRGLGLEVDDAVVSHLPPPHPGADGEGCEPPRREHVASGGGVTVGRYAHPRTRFEK